MWSWTELYTIAHSLYLKELTFKLHWHYFFQPRSSKAFWLVSALLPSGSMGKCRKLWNMAIKGFPVFISFRHAIQLIGITSNKANLVLCDLAER